MEHFEFLFLYSNLGISPIKFWFMVFFFFSGNFDSLKSRHTKVQLIIHAVVIQIGKSYYFFVVANSFFYQ